MQLSKMLCLTIIPIMGLWSYTIYLMMDSISGYREHIKTKTALEYSIELGNLIHHIQKERDMSVLYFSALAPETKTFLLSEYIESDKAISKIRKWPTDLGTYDVMYVKSKAMLRRHLAQHRQRLNPGIQTIDEELKFYSEITKALMNWFFDAVTESKFAFSWKTLVAYQKITTAKEAIGVERALGAMFFAKGGFQDHRYLEYFNLQVNTFKTLYKSARIYSDDVHYMYQYANTPDDKTNVPDVINEYRFEIQHYSLQNLSKTNLDQARMWFDNMTIIIDTLLALQTKLGNVALSKLNIFISKKQKDIAIYATCLVIVVVMCPFIVISSKMITVGIQRFANMLNDKTNELDEEKQKTDSLLYQMVPKPVADQLKKRVHTDAEYFKSVTIFFSDVYDFSRLTTVLTPMQVVEFLHTLYELIDGMLDNYDVYKVETISDSYMVASGLPNRTRTQHATEIAHLSLDILKIMKLKQIKTSESRSVTLRIGINSGPCMAGVIGSVMPRYCLFGDTVNTASRMKTCSLPNRINISHATYTLLKRTGQFTFQKRGPIRIKGKGEMRAYWLVGQASDTGYPCTDIEENTLRGRSISMPGEITQYQ